MGGWLVYLSYELAQEVEPVLRLPPSADPYSAFALRVNHLAVYDHGGDALYAISQDGDAASHARLIAQLEEAGRGPLSESEEIPRVDRWAEEAPEKYLARVSRALEHIAAGDIYQANLSPPLAPAPERGQPSAARVPGLAARQPGAVRRQPVLRRHDGAVLFAGAAARGQGRAISTRPDRGHARRSGDAEQDARDTAELIAHPKERAEHVMLIDLERNDVGRVCEAGSVHVGRVHGHRELRARAPHRLNVRGTLRPNASAVDALRALFPGGTITGCPKVRCMQIIAELEGEGRGAYTGSLGWLGTTATPTSTS
jgi:anthranilate synthase component 1